jgi:hypothetical protein
MADENEARVYGMADQANRHPPAAQGMRGENSAARTRDHSPEFSHNVTLGDGKRVIVSEGSGVSYAEATGRAGHRADNEELEVEFAPEPSRQRRSPGLPLLAGLAAVGVGIGLYAIRWFRHSGERRVPRTSREHTDTTLVPITEVAHQHREPEPARHRPF